MREATSNIGVVCEAHGPRIDPALAKKVPTFYLGKFVKKGFKTGLPKGEPQLEHMWVQVKLVVSGTLVGELNNDPACFDAKKLKCGDKVTVLMNEIEAYCD